MPQEPTSPDGPRTGTPSGTRTPPALRLILLAFLGVLTLMVATADKSFFYDEPWYLNHVGYLHDHGWGREFLLTYPGFAGPVFGMVHFVLEPLTGLRLPWVRLVNVAFLVGLMASVAATARHLRCAAPGVIGLAALAIPMNWTLSGLALTEMSSMFFLSAGILLMTRSILAGPPDTPRTRIEATAAGLLVALAIMGRQIYAALYPVFAVLLVAAPRCRTRTTLFLAAALSLPGWMFWVWGGLKPPAVFSMEAFYSEGPTLKPLHGILSLGYAAVCVGLIAPGFLRTSRRAAATCLAIALALLILIPNPVGPALSIATHVFPESWLPAYTTACSILLYTLATLLVRSIVVHVWNFRWDAPEILFSLASLALILTPLAITHVFGGRYVAIASPFLLLMVRRHIPDRARGGTGLVIGAVLGAAMLASQLHSGATDGTHSRFIKVYYPHLYPTLDLDGSLTGERPEEPR